MNENLNIQLFYFKYLVNYKQLLLYELELYTTISDYTTACEQAVKNGWKAVLESPVITFPRK